jgi:predicted O-linked N-acetylglucosamine transferase (SPINDLY family)
LLSGDFEAACVAFEALLQINPVDADVWLMLGAARHRMSKLDAARDAFLRAAVLDPQNVQSRFALATVCLALGDAKAAVAACLAAADLAPDAPDAWFSLGVAYEASGSKEAALDAYTRALQFSPDHAGALNNRRVLLVASGRIDDAVAQCRTVVARKPFSVEAQFNLGETLSEAHDFVESTRVFGRAANLSPGDARVALHYGFALAQLERFAEAQRQLDHAASVDAALVHEYRKTIFGEEQGDTPRLDARALYLLRHFDQIERCDWAERTYFLERFSLLIAEADTSPLTERALGFRAMAMGLDADLQLALARQIAEGVMAAAGENAVSQPFFACASRLNQRIRVAYISPDFRNHPTGMLARSLFAWHDRNRFEVIAYALGGDDHSELRQQIVDGCDQFIDLDSLDDDAAARRMANDSIDILVDLVGYSDKARPGILARRPAPVQISWLAYVATMGAPWIDYFLADLVALPSAASSAFSEAIIRVPDGLFMCSYAGDSLPEPPSDRRSAGLPESGLVLGAMHNSYKIDPQIFSVWMRFLELRPDAVLYLLDSSAEMKVNLMAEASARGVDPARLLYAAKLPHQAHLSRLQLIDLMLDTPQCNGGTTTADALVAGVPVLTCAGKTVAQRMAASLLTAAGQHHMITSSLETYESLGRELLMDERRLTDLRWQLGLARTSAPFFSPLRWVGNYEEGLWRAWQRHCAGETVQSFEVKD